MIAGVTEAQISGVVVVVWVAISSAVAIGGWLVHGVRARRAGGAEPRATQRGARGGRAAGGIVAALAILALPIGPSVAVFLILVALNQVLGRGENVPFSTYPMFAQPDRRSWSLVLESGSGEVVSTTAFGITPPVLRKRFGSELDRARAGSQDAQDARRRAATAVAAVLERRRPKIGPLADEPLSIVLVEYEFDGRVLHRERTVVGVSLPS